ncbi:hypothetical protein [Micromonospora sp. NPDC048169]|uniref:hypothetical protein n=1 Tax=unclassified Micromonospora TaxID=2617518 RepID=UPI0033D3E2A6
MAVDSTNVRRHRDRTDRGEPLSLRASCHELRAPMLTLAPPRRRRLAASVGAAPAAPRPYGTDPETADKAADTVQSKLA